MWCKTGTSSISGSTSNADLSIASRVRLIDAILGGRRPRSKLENHFPANQGVRHAP